MKGVSLYTKFITGLLRTLVRHEGQRRGWAEFTVRLLRYSVGGTSAGTRIAALGFLAQNLSAERLFQIYTAISWFLNGRE